MFVKHFIDNTINNKDTKGKILFDLFDTDWKNFTCGNVQPTPGKNRNQFYVPRPTNHINNRSPLRNHSRGRSRGHSRSRSRSRSRSPLRPTIGGRRRSTRKMKRRH